MIAGGFGGAPADMMMHSLDTVKTRQQGDPHMPPKYTTFTSSYYKIWRQEGIRRGLYGGWIPALGGSFPGTVIFFGTYEWSKRFLLGHGLQQHLSYLTAGKWPLSPILQRRPRCQTDWGMQVLSEISQRLSSTSPRRCSRPGSNYRDGTTTPSLNRDTTTKAL